MNPLTITLFSGSGPKSPPELAKSQNAVGYRVKKKIQQFHLRQERGKVLLAYHGVDRDYFC